MNKSNSDASAMNITRGDIAVNEDKSVGIRNVLLRYGVFFFFGVFYIITGILQPNFLTIANLLDILEACSLAALVSCAMAVVVAGGGVDVSIGVVAGLGGLIAGFLIDAQWGYEIPVFVAVLVGLGVGAAIGTVTGLLVSLVRINSFIVTIALLFIIKGFRYSFTRGSSLMMLPDSFLAIGGGRIYGISYLTLWMIPIVAALYIMMEFTKMGRYIYMIGGNIRASKTAGIGVRLYTFWTFFIAGLIAAFSGILVESHRGVGTVDMADGFLLDAFVGALLGTILLNGKQMVLGAFLGAVIFTSFINAAQILGVGPYWVYAIKGLLILMAVLINRLVSEEW